MLGIRKGNLFFMNEVLNLFSCPLTSIMIYIRMGLCFIIEIIRRGWFYYHDMFLIICSLICLSWNMNWVSLILIYFKEMIFLFVV